MNQRKLNLRDFDEVIAEIKRLQNTEYQATGDWNLAQTAIHLDHWMSFFMDGFPKLGLMAPVMWFMKNTSGKRLLNSIIEHGFSAGGPTLPATVAGKDDAEDQDAAEKLIATVERFKQFDSKLHASPLFGKLDKATATQLQLRHCEHHLGFLVPSE